MRKGSGLPPHVTAAVGAICRGYDTRERVIRYGRRKGADIQKLSLCLWLNGAIDEALELCPDEQTRAVVKQALCRGEGFDTVGMAYCGKNQFYRRKRDVKREIAKRLHLI